MLYRIKESKELNRVQNIVVNLYGVEYYTYNYSIKNENIIDVGIFTCNREIRIIMTKEEFIDFEKAVNSVYGKPINHAFGQKI